MVATVPQIVPTPAVRSRQGNRTFTLGTLSAATETRTITYDATQGVRISRDPIGEEDSSSLYVYVLNDPIDLNDFLGLLSKDACNNALSSAMNDKKVQCLMSAVDTKKCKPTIVCDCCQNGPKGIQGVTRGFHVTLCINSPLAAKDVAATLAHELTHVFDNCFGIPYKAQTDCETSACTEIRAYTNQGVCDNWKSNGYHSFEQCLKRRAFYSSLYRCGMDPKTTSDAINKVYDTCSKNVPCSNIPG